MGRPLIVRLDGSVFSKPAGAIYLRVKNHRSSAPRSAWAVRMASRVRVFVLASNIGCLLGVCFVLG